ncbi:MAG: hypothetical protein ACD_78C00362G0002 [uncultured bacterium (gcode 4)]|uniref:Uncharacterized protein n=1 Tax=uncultured bacterium (gcode 4) TaxID=1234023 RepID=K1XGY0_9BACT|nr:MAG: hypothetical protein ACD_78C00362G0002 [uncultured bacterium (gcode 4)]
MLIIAHLDEDREALWCVFADKIGNLGEKFLIELKSGDISAKEGKLGFVPCIWTHIRPIIRFDIREIRSDEDIFMWFKLGVFEKYFQ